MGGNGFNNMFKMHRLRLTMSMSNFLVVILVLVCTGSTRAAATARPLEHSPGELAWAAWLQQDNQRQDAQPPPRRITTKSLFVFPNLGQEALPACAEGYRPDSMGRCVKVVKVDETAHLEFLLQKLNSQFPSEVAEGQDENYDYDIETEATDTSGPFQLNIPIAMQIQGDKSDESEGSGSGDNMIFIKKDSKPEVHSSMNTNTSGVTVLVSSNGKFNNFTSENDKPAVNVNLENNINSDTTTIDYETTTDVISTTMIEAYLETTTLIDEKSSLDLEQNKMNKTTINRGDIIILTNQNGMNDTEDLLGQIQALKSKVESTTTNIIEIVNSGENVQNELTVDNYKKDKVTVLTDSEPLVTSSTTLKTMDIEDKIKVISRLADVTRNTEDSVRIPTSHKKGTTEKENLMIYPVNYERTSRPVDSTASASGLLHYPSVPNAPYYFNQKKMYEKNHYNSDTESNANQKSPYWWVTQGWNANSPQNKRHLLEFFSGIPTRHEYPYGTYPSHNQRPHYQNIYPNPHQSSGGISLRHMSVTHRRGRPMFNGDVQSEYEQPSVYGRGRHPHYRE